MYRLRQKMGIICEFKILILVNIIQCASLSTDTVEQKSIKVLTDLSKDPITFGSLIGVRGENAINFNLPAWCVSLQKYNK